MELACHKMQRILIHDYAGHAFPVQLSRELARRGHEVIHAYSANLLTPRGALAHKPGDPAGLSFCEVPMSEHYRRDKYSYFRRHAHEVAYGHELARLLKSLRPEIVLSGQTPTDPQWRLLRTGRAIGVPVVTWVQDMYGLAIARLLQRRLPGIGALAGAYFRWLEKRCLCASAGIVVITDDFVPILSRAGVDEKLITVIPNWASLEDIQPWARRNSWSARHGLDDKFVLLYSGTLALKHNPELLVRLARAFRSDDEVRIVAVTEGPGADYLMDACRRESLPNLLVLPFQPIECMSEVLATGDVFLAVLEPDAGVFSVPSKVLTYLAAERPLLAAIPKENLAARIVNKAEAGCCVEPGDVEGYLTAAIRVRRDPALRARYAAGGRRYAEANFAIGPITDRFEAVFRQALAREIQR